MLLTVSFLQTLYVIVNICETQDPLCFPFHERHKHRKCSYCCLDFVAISILSHSFWPGRGVNTAPKRPLTPQADQRRKRRVPGTSHIKSHAARTPPRPNTSRHVSDKLYQKSPCSETRFPTRALYSLITLSFPQGSIQYISSTPPYSCTTHYRALILFVRWRIARASRRI